MRRQTQTQTDRSTEAVDSHASDAGEVRSRDKGAPEQVAMETQSAADPIEDKGHTAEAAVESNEWREDFGGAGESIAGGLKVTWIVGSGELARCVASTLLGSRLASSSSPRRSAALELTTAGCVSRARAKSSLT